MRNLTSAFVRFSWCTAIVLYAPTAGASVIYEFSGTCTAGCTGEATGTLVLADSYTPGTQAADIDFISWSYSSSSGSYDIPLDVAFSDFGGTPGTLPALPDDQAVFAIDFAGSLTVFSTGASSWSTLFGPGGILDDAGSVYSWTFTPVPEPSTALLLSLGLIGVAAKRKRSN